mgnify:CR=1 FL=1
MRFFERRAPGDSDQLQSRHGRGKSVSIKFRTCSFDPQRQVRRYVEGNPQQPVNEPHPGRRGFRDCDTLVKPPAALDRHQNPAPDYLVERHGLLQVFVADSGRNRPERGAARQQLRSPEGGRQYGGNVEMGEEAMRNSP